MTTPYLRAKRFERMRTITAWLCLVASVLILAVIIGYRVREMGR